VRESYDPSVIAGPLDPVPTDGDLSDERITLLLNLQTERPNLDYKQTIDLQSKKGLVELAKDVGAMGIAGGYIIVGADDHGQLTGMLDGVDTRPFDEASLIKKLRKYLPPTAGVRSRVVVRDGHAVAAICVLPNPKGHSMFIAPGVYTDKGKERVVFRDGDIFWRDGTSSTRISPEGFEEIVIRRLAVEKEVWKTEQGELRRRDLDGLRKSFEARQLGQGPLGSVNFGLGADEIVRAALDLLRNGDEIALRHLLKDGAARASGSVATGDVDDAVLDTLDKLTCLAATFLDYEERTWLARVIAVLVDIYGAAFQGQDPKLYGYSSRISPNDPAPRAWLAIIERIFALGALAVRKKDWASVRLLTLQLPAAMAQDPHETNWLRHAITMASRADHLGKQDPLEPGKQASLISMARRDVSRLECLRPDGVAADDEAVLNSLVQFDVLSNIVAIGDAKEVDGRVFSPSFAVFRQVRIQPVVNQLLTDPTMRSALFPFDDDDLALALQGIASVAAREGWMSDGFVSWVGTPVGDFIEKHLPRDEAPQNGDAK
jgi:hypothetical protein